jgi:hypothetical protein
MRKHFNIKVLLQSGTTQSILEYNRYDVVRFDVGTNFYLLIEEDGTESYFPINFSIVKEIEDNR